MPKVRQPKAALPADRGGGLSLPPCPPGRPQSPHSPHPSTPASCRARRRSASTRQGKQRPESPGSRGRGRRQRCDGAPLPGHLYAEPGGRGRPASPRGFRAATRSPRAPASRLAVGRRTWLSLASEVLAHPSSRSSSCSPLPPSNTASLLVPGPCIPMARSTQAHPDSRSCTRGLGKMRQEATHTGVSCARHPGTAHGYQHRHRAGKATRACPRWHSPCPVPWGLRRPERQPPPQEGLDHLILKGWGIAWLSGAIFCRDSVPGTALSPLPRVSPGAAPALPTGMPGACPRG